MRRFALASFLAASLGALAPAASEASFLLEVVPPAVAPGGALRFDPAGGDFALADAPTRPLGAGPVTLFTSFRLGSGHADGPPGMLFYSPVPGDDQVTIATAPAGDPAARVAYRGTILGTSEMFLLDGGRRSVSVPIVAGFGDAGPGDQPYPVSLVYTFDPARPPGFQTESGFIVFGEPQPGGTGPGTGSVPAPGSALLLLLGGPLAPLAAGGRRAWRGRRGSRLAGSP